MKHKQRTKMIKGFGAMFLMVLGVFSVLSVFTPDIAESLFAFLGLGGSGGAMLANTALISGTDTREAAKTAKPDSAEKPGHLENDISKVVTKIRPDKNPLDTMLRKMNNAEKANDIQVNFEEVEFRGRKDETTAALGAPTGTTDADKYRVISVANPTMFIEGESIYIPGVVTADGKPLHLRIDEKHGDGTLTVHALNTANNVVPAIGSGTTIYRGAPSAGELKAQVGSVVHYPEMKYNYCQRFMAQVEQSYIRSMIKSNSGFNFNDQNYMKLYDMRSSMEFQHVFGQKSKTFSKKENDFVFTAEGLYHQLDNDLVYTNDSGITNDRWIDWTKELFSDDAGSTDRVLFGGRNLLADILKIDMVQKQLDATKVEIVPGLKVQKVETSFGTILIYHHKLFDQVGHDNDGMIIDMANIKKRTFLPMTSSKLELKKSGQRNVDARLVEEIVCLETRYLGTHARIVKQ
jgi:hypothetical protein